MHRTIKAHSHHLRHAARIVAVRLVDLRLQHRPHVSRLDTDHRQVRFSESTEQPLRERSGFQTNPLEPVGAVPQHLQQSIRFARYLRFPHDLARVIHNADTRLLDRNVESSKIVHAALLLLMLEAANTDLVFTISLKRSTQNIPVHKLAGRLPHLWVPEQTLTTPFPPATHLGLRRTKRCLISDSRS